MNYTLKMNETTTNLSKEHKIYLKLLTATPEVTYVILVLYTIIFLIGLVGNILVIFIVCRYKSMRTITNKFIACLSLSDLLICLFSIPFTPMNALMTSWIFGEALCQLVNIIQVISVFVSTLTSVAIAIDRYIVIVHPHTPRMSAKTQYVVIFVIWFLSSATAVPVGIYTTLQTNTETSMNVCHERWPNTLSSEIFTWMIVTLQLIVPASIITICYTSVSIQLYRRKRKMLGARDYQKEKAEAKRNKRINKMLIAMITIFIICWLPLDIFHLQLITDYIPKDYIILVFLIFHLVAMSSVMYNPFLYGWMNENFNKHFHDLLHSMKKCCRCGKDSRSRQGSPVTELTTADKTSPSQLRKFKFDSKSNGKTDSHDLAIEEPLINDCHSTKQGDMI